MPTASTSQPSAAATSAQEAHFDPKAQRKADKAARKAARKADKRAAADDPSADAPGDAHASAPHKHKKRKTKGTAAQANGAEPDPNAGFSALLVAAAASPTGSGGAASTAASPSPALLGNPAAADDLDPSLAGLVASHDDIPVGGGGGASAGDIPVDPVLLGMQHGAEGAAAGFYAAHDEQPQQQVEIVAKARKEKKDKGKGKADDAAGEKKKSKKDKRDKAAKGKDVAASSSATSAPLLPPASAAPRPAPPTAQPPPQSGDADALPIPPPEGSSLALQHQFYEDLVTKWTPVKQLKAAAEAAGATYTQGRFTTAEDAKIAEVLEAWREEHSLTPEELRTFLHTKRTPSASAGDTGVASTSTPTPTAAAATVAAGKGGEANQLWQRLGRALRTRPLLAIYNHVKTVYPSLDASQSKGERWAAADDAALSAAVKELGNAWERVGAMVGRSATACRDRWTKQLNEGKGEVLRRGAWTQEEEDELRRLHAELGGQWKAISIKMGGKRSATQCRTKWTDYMKRRDAAGDSAGFKWRPEDQSRLVHLVNAFSLASPSLTLADVDWPTLIASDADLALHGPKNVRDRFRTLANYATDKIRKDEGAGPERDVSLAEILAQLLTLHPSPTARPLKRTRLATLTPAEKKAQRQAAAAAAAAGEGGGKKKKSSEVVSSDDDDDEEDDDDNRREEELLVVQSEDEDHGGGGKEADLAVASDAKAAKRHRKKKREKRAQGDD
ncbi:SANT/Myb-like DNA-binding domain-containing protein [Rhodotorula paludigena]|uniref:SANT/Myb-like DNA-binding domain-containing protein n=1 Tax=Rhodotorula paludigena TaxID=86838 RepID=UPI00317BE6AD